MMLLAICATFRFHRTPRALAACPYRALQQHCKKKAPKKGCFEPERAVPSSLGEPRVFQPRAVSPRWLQLESGVAGSVLRLPQPLTPKLSGFPPGPTLLCALPVGSPPKVVRTLRVQAFLVSLGPRKGACTESLPCFRCCFLVSAVSVRYTSLGGSLKFVLRS